MRFDEIVGTAGVSPSQAVAHLRAWFHPDDKLCLVGMKSVRGPGQNVLSQVCTARELDEQLRSPSGKQLLEGLVLDPDGTRYNVYISVAAVGDNSTIKQRGGLDNIVSSPGVYADLDVKKGSFQSEAEIMRWLGELPEPTLVTATGSGGVHVWWKTSERLSLSQSKELQRRWWTYLVKKADGRSIDHLVDPSRVLRLAGTIRWPKPGEDVMPTAVTILHAAYGRSHTQEYLSELTRDAWNSYSQKLTRTRSEDAQRRLQADSLAKLAMSGEAAGSWALYAAIATVEDRISEFLSWDDVLQPAGWTFLREDGAGRREWSRPGSDSKSATTDWPESPLVMSLHSWSDDTGLLDLKEAGIALTLWRVALRLLWNDDYSAAVSWVLEKIRD